MSANERQVGGEHYRSAYQHWDFVWKVGADYLVGCATKYIARYKKKNGLEDVEKALHYAEKRIEVDDKVKVGIAETLATEEILKFSIDNRLDADQTYIIWALITYRFEDAVLAIRLLLKRLKEPPVIEEPELGSGRHGALGERLVPRFTP